MVTNSSNFQANSNRKRADGVPAQLAYTAAYTGHMSPLDSHLDLAERCTHQC